jgi:hypothetical protein
VFAPTNAAFAQLPAGTVDMLLKPENKAMLTKVLTYHVVAGKWSAADLKKMIKKAGGKAELKTVSGGKLWAMVHGNMIVLHDEKGGMSTVTQSDVFQSNGVIHVVDSVVLPNCVVSFRPPPLAKRLAGAVKSAPADFYDCVAMNSSTCCAGRPGASHKPGTHLPRTKRHLKS